MQYGAGRPTRPGAPGDLAAFRLALLRAIAEVLREQFPGLTQEEGLRMIREGPALMRPMTMEELLEAGEEVSAADVRPKTGGRAVSRRGPWLEIALSIPPGKARIYRVPTERIASLAQVVISTKRRRDGRGADGIWRTPIWANYERDPATGEYVLTIANDPERGVE